MLIGCCIVNPIDVIPACTAGRVPGRRKSMGKMNYICRMRDLKVDGIDRVSDGIVQTNIRMDKWINGEHTGWKQTQLMNYHSLTGGDVEHT